MEDMAYVYGPTTRNAAKVIQFWRSVGLCNLPFTRKLADIGFSFFVDVEFLKILASNRFIEPDITRGAEFPVLGQLPESFDPFLLCFLVIGLANERYESRKERRSAITYLKTNYQSVTKY